MTLHSNGKLNYLLCIGTTEVRKKAIKWLRDHSDWKIQDMHTLSSLIENNMSWKQYW